ncbi:hypothetical protein DRZ77_00870 [Candidatus Woesearchaeota archaeon]|nr:hypothetical protein [Candidatus Woesearchaeota archaeon]RLE40859.1 MAG: hypothetical protein DRZ77_00870 [Candidatus Woesearchaeota archaeon]
MVIWPFKNKVQEKNGGIVVALFGLILLALGVANPNLLTILGLNIGLLLGIICFFIGLFYFLDSTS